MANSYFETIGLFEEQVSCLGWRVVTREIDINEASDRLSDEVANILEGLEEEERKDAFHYFEARCLNTLYCSVLNRMLDRINSA